MDVDRAVRELCAALSSLGAVTAPVEIRPRRGGDAPALEEQLLWVASALVRCAPAAVRLGEDQGEEPPGRPALTLLGATLPPVHYLALPFGAEAPPFAEALALLAAGPRPAVTAGGRPRIAEVLVLVAPACPNCPQAVRAALEVLRRGVPLELAVVDVTAFPKLVSPFAPRSVPVTVVDRRVQVVGATPPERLERLLLPPGTAERDREVLRAQLDAGRPVEAAEELRRPGGLAAFVDLWQNSTLQSRMGLMLAAGEALAHDPRALDGVVAGLGPAAAAADRALRGDTAELLGAVASPEAVATLEVLAADADEEVAEAARDALEGASRS